MSEMGALSAIVAALPAAAQAARPLGGKDAFRIDGRGRAWIVTRGAVDLFLLQGGGAAESEGRRRFMLRVDEGGLLVGFEGPAEDAPLAVPTNGSELVEASWADLSSRDVDLSLAVAAGLDGWITALGGAVAGEERPPRGAKTIGPGCSPVEVEAVLQSDSVLWLQAVPGGSRVCGLETAASASTPFPLSEPVWLQCGAEGTIEALGTGELLARGQDLEAPLQSYQATVLEAVRRFWSHDQEVEAERIRKSRERRQTVLSAAVRQLTSLASGQGTAAQIDTSRPLEAAVALVGKAQSIDLDPEAIASSTGPDPISAITRRAGLHHRAVLLEPGWWRSDEGPLVGFLGSWERPCALLPRSARSYVLVDTSDASERIVDDKVAAELSTRAFALYKPLPEGQLALRDLVRTGFPNARSDLLAILGMSLLFGLLSLLTPIFASEITETVIPEAQVDQLLLLIIALGTAAVASAGFALVQSIAVLRLEGRADAILQAGIWDRLMRAPVSFFRNFTVGDLNQRALSIEMIRRTLSAQAVTSVLSAASGVVSLGLLFYYDVLLGALVLVVLMAWAFVTFRLSRRLADIASRRLRLERQQLTKAFQFVSGINKLRASGSEQFAYGIWSRIFADIGHETMAQLVVRGRLSVLNTMLPTLATALVIAVIALQGDQLFAFFDTAFTWSQIKGQSLTGVMTTAEFVGFNVALAQVTLAAQTLGGTLASVVTIKPTYEQMTPIFEIDSESEVGSEDPGDLSGEIEVADVHFRYDPQGAEILKGLSLKVEPGQHVAIVGPSGSGKSTLIRLLLGFETPEAGTIFLDGRDLRRLDKRAVRRNFGVVLQQGRLLTGSIYENIVAGANLSEADAWEAARAAGLAEDIEAMPMGMHTVLAEGASTISGGQRQRLMIARAIVHRPRILIFDEATSALDNRTQAIVTESLNALQCTRISIAHRISTIEKADKIVVVDAGQVVEEGRFEELIAANGAFAVLARRQIAET